MDQILKGSEAKDEQLGWMEDDVKHLKPSTPIVVFAHVPLWSVYPEWGWVQKTEALAYLKKFGSVTVLNGGGGLNAWINQKRSDTGKENQFRINLERK